MSSIHRNFWSRKAEFLDSSNGIPTDVTFVIEDNEGVQAGEVKAHKMFLAIASPVFRNMFYGSAKDTRDTIPVRETTKEAFEAMLDFIYETDIDWETKGVVELFYLANMAKKYLIDEMGECVENVLATVPLTLESVVETADTAEEFSQFEETSEALFLHCAMFLRSHLTTANSCFKFAAQYCETDLNLTSLKLLGKIGQLEQQEPKNEEDKDIKKCTSGHPLVKVPNKRVRERWRCNSNLPSCQCFPKYDIYEIVNRYRCKSCDFDNCEDCFKK